jgi:hypothetical protein
MYVEVSEVSFRSSKAFSDNRISFLDTLGPDDFCIGKKLRGFEGGVGFLDLDLPVAVRSGEFGFTVHLVVPDIVLRTSIHRPADKKGTDGESLVDGATDELGEAKVFGLSILRSHIGFQSMKRSMCRNQKRHVADVPFRVISQYVGTRAS